MNEELYNPPRSFAGVQPEGADADKAGAVILPVPYDSTTEYRSGTREGPRAIIDASQYLELYDIELGREITETGILTLPEVQPHMGGPGQMVERVYRVASSLVDKGSLVVMLGGEHSLTLGMVRAFREKYRDLSVLHLDAHTDLRDRYMGTGYSHACVMRRVRELCPVVHAGIRSLSLEEFEYMKRQNIEPFYVESLAAPGGISGAAALLSGTVYISIDLDVLDPSIMAAVGTPEPGGLSWQQLLDVLKAAAAGRKIVGFDLVELCPREGPNACSFIAAKLAYKLIGYATQAGIR